MADLVLATIDPSGSGDYTTLSACEAGEQRDWVAADEFGVWEAQGNWDGSPDNSFVIIAGQVTDADHDITIRTDAANRHAGIWDTGKYIVQRINTASGFINFNGLQIGTTGHSGGVDLRISNGTFVFESCVFRNSANSRSAISCEGSSTTTVANCVFDELAGVKEAIQVSFDAVSCEVLASTAYGADRGLRNIGATVTAYNVLADASADVDFAGTIGGSNNASGDGTAPGANSITNGTFVFEDQPNGDFQIAAADTSGAKTGGTDLSAHSYPVTVDIAGTPRSATPTIGAFEFAGSGPDVTVDGDADVTSPTASGSAEISVSASGAALVVTPVVSGSVSSSLEANGSALVVSPVVSGSVSSSLEANGSALVVSPVASGSVESSLEVTGSATVNTPFGSGTVEMSVDVSGAPLVTIPTASGFVTVNGSSADVTVTGDADVVSPTASGSGSVSVSASGAALVLPPGANGSVETSLEVSGSSVVVPPTASGEVSPGVHVSGAGSVLPLLGSSTGVITVPVSGSPSIVPLTASGSVSFSLSLSGASTVSPLSASGFVFVGNVLPGAYTSIPILELTYDPIRVDFLDSYSIDLELE